MDIRREEFVIWLTTPSMTGLNVVTACLATLLTAFIVFYTAFLFATSHSSNAGTGTNDSAASVEEEANSSHDEDEVEDSDPDQVSGIAPLLSETTAKEEWKMVLLVRTDLEMGKGKAAAQCCHATLAAVRRIEKTDPKGLKKWEQNGQAKVTLKCPNEEDMLELQKLARSKGLVAQSIRDAGRTQIAANTRTVLAVGPGPKSLIDKVCGHLKLY